MKNLWYNSLAFGGVAQLGERTVRIRKVKGSNPSVSTIKTTCFLQVVFYFEGFEPCVIPERFRRAAAGASGDIVHEVTLAALRIPPSPP